ncbi:MAG TPA: 2-oxoglutarate dehydrogenase E1 component, partial [Burkholderiales bacterium]
MASVMQEYLSNSYLFGSNAPFIEELYEAYLANPDSVAGPWREYFDALQQGAAAKDVAHGPVIESFVRLAKQPRVAPSAAAIARAEADARKQVSVLQFINAHRFLGVRQANLDPLKRQEHPYIQELDPAHYGLTEADMDLQFNVGSFVGGAGTMTLRELIKALRQTYCGTIGVEYMYIADVQQKRWIQSRLESIQARAGYTPE